MFINHVTLHRCNRFYVKGIETLSISPTLKTQIVLGTNGCGKSSLLKLGFSVLPGEKHDYEVGGYKLVRVLHEGQQYELRSDRTAKAMVHSFKRIIGEDEFEELNDGHTAAVQRELVKEVFGMSITLHDVLTGNVTFTGMNNTTRREWITLLSSANFDYVIKLYSKIKRAARDQGVIIRHLSERVVEETSKKIDETTFNALKQQSSDTYSKLMELQKNAYRDGLAPSFSHYEREYTELCAEIEGILSKSSALRGQVPVIVSDTSSEAVIELKESLRSRVQMLEAALHEVSARHSDLDKQLHDLDALEDIDPKELSDRITVLQDSRDELLAKFKTIKVEGDNYRNIPDHTYCFQAVNDVMSLLHSLNPRDENMLDRNIYTANQRKLTEIQNQLIAGQSRIGELEYRLNHIHNCSAVSCPNCNHSFKEGVSRSEEQEIKDSLEKGYTFRKTMQSKIDSLVEWLRDANQLAERHHELNQIRNRNPDLNHLWGIINEAGGFGLGRELVPLCNRFMGDVQTNVKLAELNLELAPLVSKYDACIKLDRSGQLRDIALTLSDRVIVLQNSLMDARDTLREVTVFHDRMTQAREISKTVEMSKSHLDYLMDQMVRFIAVEEIESQVKRHQVKLGLLEQSLAEAEIQMGIINDLNKSIAEARDEEVALTMLEKLLSPKDGIIAEQILVFINTFIMAINDVIAKFWGYNLALELYDLEEGELDYKFPMYIHSPNNLIPDISLGSDSQVDIINQAFVIVVYDFLELKDYPLHLDELGRTFDEVHRLNLTLGLKDIMADEKYSQIFFISHSFESQNSFPDSELVVIDDSHVTLKRAYNQHVEIS